MAHADYHCCAICDCKLDYASGCARTKEDLCTSCLKMMHEQGAMVYDGEDLVEWIRDVEPERVLVYFLNIGYRMCHYENPVDDAFCEVTGIERERGQYITEEMVKESDLAVETD